MTSPSVRQRAATVVVALAFAASMTACSHSAPAPVAPAAPATQPAEPPVPQAPPSAPAAEPRSVPLRPAGDATYRLSITSDEGRGVSRLVTEFVVTTATDGRETVALRAARRGPPSGPLADVTIDEACRRDFGGDHEVLGRFAVSDSEDLSGLVPPGVPEPLFGAATDLLAFLQVQRAIGTSRLRSPGDVATLPGFTARWSRPSGATDARVSAASVTVTLAAAGPGALLLRWDAAPMDFAMVRTSPQGRGWLLMRGREHLSLEVSVDPRDGRLLGGRSLRDEVDAAVHLPWPAAKLPADGDPWPEGPGIPAKLARELVLERISP